MKNLNAEQIKKAFEHCINKKDCSDCVIKDKEPRSGCLGRPRVFFKSALDLINSQEQKIKELTEENAPKWIPIESNEKPQHLKNYFIAYVFGDSDMRFYGEAKYHAYGGNGIVDGAHFSNEGVADMRVTHWMPIPKLP